jgi:hypothetical protein
MQFFHHPTVEQKLSVLQTVFQDPFQKKIVVPRNDIAGAKHGHIKHKRLMNVGEFLTLPNRFQDEVLSSAKVEGKKKKNKKENARSY